MLLGGRCFAFHSVLSRIVATTFMTNLFAHRMEEESCVAACRACLFVKSLLP